MRQQQQNLKILFLSSTGLFYGSWEGGTNIRSCFRAYSSTFSPKSAPSNGPYNYLARYSHCSRESSQRISRWPVEHASKRIIQARGSHWATLHNSSVPLAINKTDTFLWHLLCIEELISYLEVSVILKLLCTILTM